MKIKKVNNYLPIVAVSIGIAAILAYHGVIVCGMSMDHAVKFAELVEKLAKVYWGTLQVGEPKIISEIHLERFQKLHDSLFANYPRSKKRK